jgi:hypothetical protein
MRREKVHTGFWWGNLSERYHLADLHVDGMIILKWIFKKWYRGNMERTDLAQDRNRWQAFINAVISLQIPQNEGNSLTDDSTIKVEKCSTDIRKYYHCY